METFATTADPVIVSGTAAAVKGNFRAGLNSLGSGVKNGGRCSSDCCNNRSPSPC